MDAENKTYPNRWYVLLLFAIPLGLYFWFGLQHLTQFETADEHFWLAEEFYNINTKKTVTSRIPSYWEAMRAKDWKDTDINDKPGISLAIISGLGQYIQKGWADRIAAQMKFSQIYDPQKTEQMNRSFRLPILVFNGVMLVYVLLVLRRLLRNNWTSLIAASLIALCPILIGISQIINPDSLLWTFAISSLLTFMLFVLKGKWWDAILASVLLGFAFLSKYTAVIMIPFFFAVILMYLFVAYKELEHEGRFRRKAIVLSLAYPFIIAAAIGIFALGMPAVILDPDKFRDGVRQIGNFDFILSMIIYADAFVLADAILLKSFFIRNAFRYTQFLKHILPRTLYVTAACIVVLVVVNWGLKHNFLNIPDIQPDVRDKKLFGQQIWQIKLILELYPLVFSLTPIVLFGALLAWIKNTIKPRIEDMFILLSLSTFLAVFYVGVILQGLQVNIRYSVIAYPVVAVIAAIGLAIPFNAFERFRFNNLVKMFLFFAIIGVSAWNVWLIKPFYFNYMSDVLPREYIVNGGWGYGAYEAAEYINAQARDPRTISAWTDYEGFCPFFAGRCYKGSQIKWNKKEDVDNIDYYVTSRRGMMLSDQMWADLTEYRSENPVWELNIDARPDNFIRVYENIKK